MASVIPNRCAVDDADFGPFALHQAFDTKPQTVPTPETQSARLVRETS